MTPNLGPGAFDKNKKTSHTFFWVVLSYEPHVDLDQNRMSLNRAVCFLHTVPSSCCEKKKSSLSVTLKNYVSYPLDTVAIFSRDVHHHCFVAIVLCFSLLTDPLLRPFFQS
eukprot:TRINITY_DN1398_c0_g2_i6.p1 TRINITY_DN1398_c0_g2~~TRINITY_DN1398_c0_g2_i6.p1  ORF type:complete len:111 (+),score=4.92 TRINITY_DN1398_c0_g2_i6:725-1057(+)